MVAIGTVLCFFCCFNVTRAWLLAQCGLNESYRVLHLSTHFARVFLSITVESNNFPTLIETQWPDNYLPALAPILYPRREAHANGVHTDCGLIQQATWSQVDSLSRLWVMDMGWSGYNDQADQLTCNPKLLVFDLIRNNLEVLRIDCGKYIRADGNSQVLDIGLGPRTSPCGSEKFLYFVLSDDSHLYAYDILEQRWHHKQLKSKKYSTISEFLPIKPRDLTFNIGGEILISDEDGNLYTAPNIFHNSTLLRSDTIEMFLLGTLLGPTRGLMVDPYGILFYVVTKFGAVVRCEYKEHITTEDSEIIHMTSKNIQQIFFGSEGSVWLLSDRWLRPHDQCISDY